jgi:hypothetical protein
MNVLAPNGGRLREEASGVGRSQAVHRDGAFRPRKGDWSDLWIECHREAQGDLE